MRSAAACVYLFQSASAAEKSSAASSLRARSEYSSAVGCCLISSLSSGVASRGGRSPSTLLTGMGIQR